MKLPRIIQGGMGVGVSGWQLARAVSLRGELGVVSGTGLNSVMIRRLQRGDADGSVRRALDHFFDQTIAQKIIESYYVSGGNSKSGRFKRTALPAIKMPLSAQRIFVASGFVEVWLAKEGHSGIVGINFLEKLQTSNLPTLYGAMLAGVDVVLMGAGLPKEIPGVLDRLAKHQDVSISVNAVGSIGGAEASQYRATLSPRAISNQAEEQPIFRPMFFPIVSSSTLAQHLLHRSTGTVEGFVVEGIKAGGHNAPPRGPMKLSERGEPIYGERDAANIKEIRELGLPFWLAGNFGSSERLDEALRLGASGIQVGTAFAFCDESGLAKDLRDAVIRQWITNKKVEGEAVFTDPQASPTGFPFKVILLPGTLSESELYLQRPRKCDLGYLRQLVVLEDGSTAYRCSAEPIDDYIRKGGTLQETKDRKCLCNALMANIGLAQEQKDGYVELPLLTAGDDLVNLSRFLKPGSATYSVEDVLVGLLGPEHTLAQGN